MLRVLGIPCRLQQLHLWKSYLARQPGRPSKLLPIQDPDTLGIRSTTGEWFLRKRSSKPHSAGRINWRVEGQRCSMASAKCSKPSHSPGKWARSERLLVNRYEGFRWTGPWHRVCCT
jgi:hypothetical protein